jgi:hypothetical protein
MSLVEPAVQSDSEIEVIVRDTVRRIEALNVDHRSVYMFGPEPGLSAKPRPWFAGATIFFGQCAMAGVCLVAAFQQFVTGSEIGDATGIVGIGIGALIFACFNPTPFFKNTIKT